MKSTTASIPLTTGRPWAITAGTDRRVPTNDPNWAKSTPALTPADSMEVDSPASVTSASAHGISHATIPSEDTCNAIGSSGWGWTVGAIAANTCGTPSADRIACAITSLSRAPIGQPSIRASTVDGVAALSPGRGRRTVTEIRPRRQEIVAVGGADTAGAPGATGTAVTASGGDQRASTSSSTPPRPKSPRECCAVTVRTSCSGGTDRRCAAFRRASSNELARTAATL